MRIKHFFFVNRLSHLSQHGLTDSLGRQGISLPDTVCMHYVAVAVRACHENARFAHGSQIAVNLKLKFPAKYFSKLETH